MALVPKLSKPVVSSAGLYISTSDITGVYEATDNPGGYGTPNFAVGSDDSVYLFLSMYGEFSTIGDTVYTNSTIPTSTDISTGTSLQLSSDVLDGITPLVPFRSGIIEIDMFRVPDYIYDSSPIVIGDLTVTGPDLGYFPDADVVKIGDDFYPINKEETNTSNIIYLLVPVKSTGSLAYGGTAVQYTQYALNLAELDSIIAAKVSALCADDGCGCGCNNDQLDTLLGLEMDRLAAIGAYKVCNYKRAHRIVTGAIQRTKNNKDCGCN